MKKTIKKTLIALLFISTTSFSMQRKISQFLKRPTTATTFAKGKSPFPVKPINTSSLLREKVNLSNFSMQQTAKIFLIHNNKKQSIISPVSLRTITTRAYLSSDYFNLGTPHIDTSFNNHDTNNNISIDHHDRTLYCHTDLFASNENATIQSGFTDDSYDPSVDRHGSSSIDSHGLSPLDIAQHVFITYTPEIQRHRVENNFIQFTDNVAALSPNNIATTREGLNSKLIVLEAKEWTTLNNAHVQYLIATGGDGIAEFSQEEQKWFYEQAIATLDNKVEIDATKLAIKYCDTIIDSIDRETMQFSEDLKDASLDTLEKEVMPSITAKQQIIQTKIVQKEHLLENQNAELKSIEIQLEPFNDESNWTALWAKFKGFLNTDSSQDSLRNDKHLMEMYIKNTRNELKGLHDTNRMYDAQFDCAQNNANALHALDELKQQETRDNLWQDLGMSSDACTLIHESDVILTTFENLSPDAQREVVDFLNHGAYEKKNIGDSSYDGFFTETVKIADSACQAYHKGNYKLGSALVDAGNKLIDCTVAFSKGVVHGVGNGVKNNCDVVCNVLTHPIKTLEGIAHSIVNIANFVIKHDGPLVALSLCPINSIVALGANIAESLVDTAQKLSEMPLVEAFEKLGEMAGEGVIDYMVLDGAIKAASVVKNIAVIEAVAIIRNAEQDFSAAGKLTQAERAALANSEKLVVAADNGLTLAMEAQQVEIAEKIGAKAAAGAEAQSAKASLKHLDPSVGNIDKLENAIELFKGTPGAIGKDGAITKLAENGKLGVDVGKLGTARGAAYELEAALEIEKSGRKVLEFGKKIGGREFDAVTKDALIEFKNINWEILSPKSINDMQSKFGKQLKVAQEVGMRFEVHSKGAISAEFKSWFNKHNIQFFEGCK
ncbi:MAG: hypothetical protein P4L31_00625 [Candidatus Babeliales bacterium]|nr:hypothetical protein [Candidatus Babeliales bacterium]